MPVRNEMPSVNSSTRGSISICAVREREAGDERRQHRQRGRGEHDADEPPAIDSSDALGQELANQLPASGAERGADGQLPLAPQQPRQREVGDVRAGDQQHETGRAQQDQQQRPRLARQLVAHRQVVAVKPDAAA